MGRHHSTSEYYPPRARWYSGLLMALDGLRRRVWLDRVHLPSGLSIGVLLTSLLIPGWGFRARGGHTICMGMMGASAVLAVAFIVFLGQGLGNLAFGLLLAIHTVSVYYLVSPLLMDARYLFRVGFMMALLMMLGMAGYMPIRDFVQNHWLLPLTYRGNVMVVNRRVNPRAMHVGDVVAYRIEGSGGAHEGVLVREGYGLGPVIAVGGDKIVFTLANILVNDVAQPRREHMPTDGEWVVPQNHWFIWPEFGIRNAGNAGAAGVTGAMLGAANVPSYRLVGKPFKRWFFHRQLPL